MEHTDSLDTIANLGPGHHVCWLYETEEEHRAVLTPFLRQGLERGEKVLYIMDAHGAETILGYLRDDGLDVEPYLARQQLTIVTSQSAYMQQDVFDPDEMIALLRAETERALAEGHTALRATGEMGWALGRLPRSERLMEYEAKLNEFFPGSDCLGMCQYDRRAFSSALLLDVLCTHPVAVIGTGVYDNPYYVPPAGFLGDDPAAEVLRHWLEHLAERKRAEEALRKREQEMRMIADNVPALFSYLGADGCYRFVNKRYEEWFGIPQTEVIGKHHRQVLGEATYDLVKDRVEMALSGQRVRYEQALPYTHGGTRWVTADYVPDTDEQGKVKGFFALVTDISERKRAEDALGESEEKCRALFEQPPDSVLLIDAETGALAQFNDRAHEILGYTREEFEKLRIPDFEVIESPEEIAKHIEKITREGADAFETEHRTKSGDIRDVEVRTRAISIRGRDFIQTIFRDVTQQKRAEEALQKVRDELESRVERRMQQVNGYRLTFRELTVLHLVAAGQSDKEIATVLGISPLTAHKHLANILEKMGAACRTEAGVRALREGLLD